MIVLTIIWFLVSPYLHRDISAEPLFNGATFGNMSICFVMRWRFSSLPSAITI